MVIGSIPDRARAGRAHCRARTRAWRLGRREVSRLDPGAERAVEPASPSASSISTGLPQFRSATSERSLRQPRGSGTRMWHSRMSTMRCAPPSRVRQCALGCTQMRAAWRDRRHGAGDDASAAPRRPAMPCPLAAWTTRSVYELPQGGFIGLLQAGNHRIPGNGGRGRDMMRPGNQRPVTGNRPRRRRKRDVAAPAQCRHRGRRSVR